MNEQPPEANHNTTTGSILPASADNLMRTDGPPSVTYVPSECMLDFNYEHLRPDLQAVSKPFCELARSLDRLLPDHREKTKCLDHLLYAKDAAVRTFLRKR